MTDFRDKNYKELGTAIIEQAVKDYDKAYHIEKNTSQRVKQIVAKLFNGEKISKKSIKDKKLRSNIKKYMWAVSTMEDTKCFFHSQYCELLLGSADGPGIFERVEKNCQKYGTAFVGKLAERR